MRKLILVISGMALYFTAFSQERVNLGKKSEFQNKFVSPPKSLRSSQSNETTLKLPGNKNVQGRINLNSGDVVIGNLKNEKNSTFYINFSDNQIKGHILRKGRKEAYVYKEDSNGDVYLEKKDIHEVLCIEYSEARNKSTLIARASSNTVATQPSWQSLPGATAVVLLDFDGQYVSGTPWNGGNPIDAAPSGFSESVMKEIFDMVSEDFRSFNLNITTDETVFNAAPVNRRMRCIFTPTKTAAPGAGGVAYLNSFTWNNDTPCWVFNGGAKAGGEAGSHEIGHTLGLLHDGRTSPKEEYYKGQGTWAPIMGVAYSKSLSQWSKGEYANPSQTQDDLAKISGNNGFTYRNDDYANDSSTRAILSINSSGAIAPVTGIIERNKDADVFRFNTSGGNVSIAVSPAAVHANLDIKAQLVNSIGRVILESAPTSSLSCTLQTNLSAGHYFLLITNSGFGSPATDGYSAYGSIGQYTVSGTIPNSNTIVYRNPENPTNVVNGINFNYVEGTWNALPDFTTLTKIKTGTQSQFDLSNRNRDDFFGFEFTGFVQVPADAVYTFFTTSDDGSKLFIGTTEVVNNDGLHGASEASGTIPLKAGRHAIRVVFFENGGGQTLSVAYSGGGITKQTIPASALYRIGTVQNQSPTVSITAPTSESSYNTPTSVTLSANAADVDGIISSVQFYLNGTLVGTDLTAPYSVTVNVATAGTYSVYARATDNAGAATNSSNVNFLAGTSTSCSVAAWSSSAVYVAGNRASYNGKIYEAKWWTQNENPELRSGQWDVWKLIGTCTARLSADGFVESESLNMQLNLSVTPNPATEMTTLWIESPEASFASIEILSLDGKLLKTINSASISEGINTLDLSLVDIPNGIYQVVVRMKNSANTFRIIKN